MNGRDLVQSNQKRFAVDLYPLSVETVRLTDRMSELMSTDPDWRDEAWEIVGMLDRSDIFVLPEGETPKAWCRSLFEHSGLSILARAAIKMDLEVEEVGRPIDLLVLLLPSDHHLD